MRRRPGQGIAGGVAMAAVGASAGFGAICGSSLATASTMGKVALPELRRLGHPGSKATGTLAASGTLGVLIPPSLLLLIYSILAEQNVVKLFYAALIPAALAVAGYLVAVRWAYRTQSSAARLPRMPYGQRLKTLRPIWPIVLIFLTIFVGMLQGWFSPTSAASIGATGTGLIVLMQGRLSLRGLGASLVSALQTAAMIMMIVVGANVFNVFLASAGVPAVFAETFLTLNLSPIWIIFFMLLLYLVLGMVMDSLAMVFLTVPLFLPIVMGLDLGFEYQEEALIWFGILVLTAAEVGLITPPVGLNLFVINKLATDVPLGQTYRGVLPFIVSDVVRIALLLSFPFLSLWLVRLFFDFVPDF